MACRDLVDSGVWNIRRAPVLELDAHVYGTSIRRAPVLESDAHTWSIIRAAVVSLSVLFFGAVEATAVNNMEGNVL